MAPVVTASSGSRRMAAVEVTDLPEPDSPTNASVSPSTMVKLTSLTAVTGPVGNWNVTLSLSISSRG